MHHVIIIGSGPAGLSAALYTARAGLEPIVITGSPCGGQLMRTDSVKNWLGIQDISGPALIENFKGHITSYGAQLLLDEVASVALSPEEKKVTLVSGKTLSTKALIIACGGKPKKLSCPGAAQYENRGIYAALPQNLAPYQGKKVAIIGGGNSAITFAARLLEAGAYVVLVQSQGRLTATDRLVHFVQNHKNVEILCYHTTLMVNGDSHTVREITLQNTQSETSITIPVAAILVAIGAGPNTELFKGQLLISNSNHIVVQPGTSLTSMQGVFAAGDVCDSRYRHAATSAGQGCMAALDAELYLNGKVIVRFQ